MKQLPITYLLPTLPKAVGEVATTIGYSMTVFTDRWYNAVVYMYACICSQWKVDLDFKSQ
jgi:hypothetical protein